MGLIKNLLPAVNGGKRTAELARAETFMQAKARGTVEFSTEEEAAAWYLELAEVKWGACMSCPLGRDRTHVVYGEGAPQPDLLILGEAPGESEDLSGVPFVGEAGLILRKAIRSPRVGLGEFKLYFSNTVCCRPARNRKPEKEEREACQPRLLELLRILRPKAILLLGASAGHWFGVREVGVNRGIVPRTAWPALGEGALRLRAVVQGYHPSWILHQDKKAKKIAAFEQFVADLILARRVLQKIRLEEEARA